MNWKKPLSLFVAVAVLAIAAYGLGRHNAPSIGAVRPVQVCFSPNGGCTEAIIKQIDDAKSKILIQAYSFTSTPIAKALLEAHKRGVKVEAILDKSQKTQNYSSATFLANSRIPTFIDSVHAIAHNKVMIIDGKIVITGSFNFTKAAESKNAENLLILQSPELAKLYTENWNRHLDHSEPYEPRD
jgi:phosphatidylserine/phosphatidylglycerophosphate/cardiolipin synthase-like enzyme